MSKGLIIAGLEHRLRRFLSQALPPDKFVKLYSRTRTWFLDMLATSYPEAYVPQRAVKVSGVTFRNDLGNAAGLDKDGKLLAFHYLLGAGFAVIGTVLPYENEGVNIWTPLPYSNSALNTLALPSHGVDSVVENVRSFKDTFEPVDFPIGASVMGHPKDKNKPEELTGIMYCLEKLFPYVDFIEVNESCPNTPHGNDNLELRLKSIANKRDEYCSRIGRYIPVFVKSRDAGEADYTVELMMKCGMDGLILTNTQIKYDVLRPLLHPNDHKLFDYYLELSGKRTNGVSKGGASGPIIKEIAFAEVEKAAKAIEQRNSSLIIGHVGGLSSFADMERSRAISPVVKFREWYTGEMNALGIVPVSQLYRNTVLGVPAQAYSFRYIRKDA